jgi:hypothetical protein
VDDEGEVHNWGFLSADVVDSDLGVRHTSVVPGFRVGFASANSVATSWSAAHQ